MVISGQISGVNAGTYSAAFTPKSGYQWPDGSNIAKTVTWIIDRATINKLPSQSGTLVYTGETLTPEWADYDKTKMTISGTTTGTDRGSYVAYFTPTENYKWYDGSEGVKAVTWYIKISSGSVTFINSGTFNPVSYGLTVGMKLTVSAVGGGGGGAGYGSTNAGGDGGNSGVYVNEPIILSDLSIIPVTIGAGGGGGSSTRNSESNRGSAGGTTSFGTHVSAVGGDGGAGSWQGGDEGHNTVGRNMGGRAGYTYGHYIGGGGGAGGAYVSNDEIVYPNGSGGNAGEYDYIDDNIVSNGRNGGGISGGGGAPYRGITSGIGGTSGSYKGGDAGGRNSDATSPSPFGGSQGTGNAAGGGGAGYGSGGGGASSQANTGRGGSGYRGILIVSWEAQ